MLLQVFCHLDKSKEGKTSRQLHDTVFKSYISVSNKKQYLYLKKKPVSGLKTLLS